jgi:hypothetical protein
MDQRRENQRQWTKQNAARRWQKKNQLQQMQQQQLRHIEVALQDQAAQEHPPIQRSIVHRGAAAMEANAAVTTPLRQPVAIRSRVQNAMRYSLRLLG